MHVTQEARRSILVDLLTVHALGGKAIVFTQTKREADEVAASLSLVHPCEVSTDHTCQSTSMNVKSLRVHTPISS